MERVLIAALKEIIAKDYFDFDENFFKQVDAWILDKDENPSSLMSLLDNTKHHVIVDDNPLYRSMVLKKADLDKLKAGKTLSCRKNKPYESWSLSKDPFAGTVDVEGKPSKRARSEDEVTVLFKKSISSSDRILYIPKYLELVIDWCESMMERTRKKKKYKDIRSEAKSLYNHFGKTEKEFIVKCQKYTANDIESVVESKTATGSKEWFETKPTNIDLKSDELKYFLENIYDANYDEKHFADNIAEEMKEEGLNPYDVNSEDYSEYNERLSEAEDDLSTNRLFKKPKILKNVRLIHFTETDPNKLIQDIENGDFDGCDGSNMGVTVHTGCSWGPLGFGYLADQKITKSKTGRISQYGDNVIEFTAIEAIQAYHDSDGEEQIIWDANYVKDLKVAYLKGEKVEASEQSDIDQRSRARKAFRSLQKYLEDNAEAIKEAADQKEILNTKTKMEKAPFFWDKQGNFTIPLGNVDSDLEDLWVMFTSDNRHSGIGKSPKLPGISIMILAGKSLKGPFNAQYLHSRMDAKRFVHEFIHYLDEKRIGEKKGSAKKFDEDDIKGYFNDPLEYNAYYQETLQGIENMLENETVQERVVQQYSAKKFIDFVIEFMDVDFIDNLEPKYRKKILKRLARFYDEVVEPMRKVKK